MFNKVFMIYNLCESGQCVRITQVVISRGGGYDAAEVVPLGASLLGGESEPSAAVALTESRAWRK